jgi:hypothetical protein
MRARSLFPTAETPPTEALRAAIEVEETGYLWGDARKITPRLVGETFGDGRRLVFIEPTMTRPNYYIVRVDSGWNFDGFPTHGDDTHESPDWREELDLIWELIECEYGIECCCPSSSGEEYCEDCGGERDGDFPVVGDTSCAWGTVDWPATLWPSVAAEVA